jgi:hypothetical protein
MQALRVLPLLATLAFGTAGCQVMRRAEECQELSQILKEAAPELEQKPILDNPTEKDLRTRARLYGQLGQTLQKVKLEGKPMRAEADQLIKELFVLETELNRAAQVVSEYATSLKEPQEEDAPSEVAVPRAPEDAGPQKKTGAPSDQGDKFSVVPGIIPPKRIPPSRARKQKELGFVQGYNRARRAARMAGQNVTGSVARLQKLCL